MTEEELQVLRAEIAFSIKTTVNGKIDGIRADLQEHNEKHEEDMKRIMPVVEAYESALDDVNTAKRGGKTVIWLAGAITAIGGAYLVLKSIFPWL